MFKDAINDPVITADDYWLLNGSISLLGGDGTWELSVWAKNLTDEEYVRQGLNVSALGLGNRNYNPPRTFGASISYRFGS